jgi:hypothetical protein
MRERTAMPEYRNGVEYVKLPYSNWLEGLTDREVEIHFVIEGRTVRAFVNRNRVDFDQKVVQVPAQRTDSNSSIIELPGEPLNSPRRLAVSNSWLKGCSVP